MAQIWTPEHGYGPEVEPKRHPMLSLVDGRVVVDYEYKGEDAVLLNRTVMPLGDQVNKLFTDVNFNFSTGFVSLTAGYVLFEVETPLLYALLYSRISALGPTTDTATILHGYQRVIRTAVEKFSLDPEKAEEIAKTVVLHEEEKDIVYKQLMESLIENGAFLGKVRAQADTAITKILIAYTLSYIVMIERHVWRLYGRFSKVEAATRISTKMLSSICAAPDKSSSIEQGKTCISWYKTMGVYWNMLFPGIPLKNRFRVDDTKFLLSKYHYGVNVKQALAMFDIFKQKSKLEVKVTKVIAKETKEEMSQ